MCIVASMSGCRVDPTLLQSRVFFLLKVWYSESMKMDKVAGSGNDEFYTPAYAIEPLLKYLRTHTHTPTAKYLVPLRYQ